MDNKNKYNELREKYKLFKYNSFKYSLYDNFIEIEYDFEIEGLSFFKPTLKVPFNSNININKDTLETFIFNIGMVEAISYYKITCPKEIYVNYYLDDKQIKFYKKLFLNGLGEFYYTNNIDLDPDFATFTCNPNNKLNIISNDYDLNPNKDCKVLVNVGGGKDSVVSLELLKDKCDVYPFVMNQRLTTSKCIEIAGLSAKELFSSRTLDKNMLELNKQGYLNGHTPFSALVSFVSCLVAYLNGIKFVALSNESSANEPTVKDSIINHQYSKSYEYELDFVNYEKEYIKSGVSYFSFLRPLWEIQIASLFSNYPKYYYTFRSCNVGQKKDIWCGNCPKCLFVYIIMSSFIDRNTLIDIFNKDLFNDPNLLPIFNKLIGIDEEKPFECVGSRDEVNIALNITLNEYLNNNIELPYLLKYYQSLNIKVDTNSFRKQYDRNNNLLPFFSSIIKEQLC